MICPLETFCVSHGIVKHPTRKLLHRVDRPDHARVGYSTSPFCITADPSRGAREALSFRDGFLPPIINELFVPACPTWWRIPIQQYIS